MIRYLEGVEGSGKTCMLTRDLYRHKMYGGRVLTLPGYELYGRTKKVVLSEVIFPEQILQLIMSGDTELIRKQKIAIAMDEVTNFFSHHNWQNLICDILYAVLAQRRKLGVAIHMTGPEFEVLPKDIRFMIHEIVHCTNAHSFNRAIPNDLICKYYKEDRRGMLSNPRFHFSYRHKFYMKKWQKHYDTYAAVGFGQNVKVRIEKREVLYDSSGNLINKGIPELDYGSFDGILGNYQPKEAQKYNRVKEVISYLKERGVERADNQLLCDMLQVPHLMGRNGVGSVLTALGAKYNNKKKVYDLAGVEI